VSTTVTRGTGLTRPHHEHAQTGGPVMVRHGIVAGEPDHTGLGRLSRQLQRLFSRPVERQPRTRRRARRLGRRRRG
jgi:hypothetical protein